MTYYRGVSSTSIFARSALAAAVLVLAAGCGDDDGDAAADPAGDDSTSQSPSDSDGSAGQPEIDLPACAEVWVGGARLPRNYHGCEQDGAAVKADKHECSYGASIIEFDDRFYAVNGKTINEVPSLTDSEQFHRALNACQG